MSEVHIWQCRDRVVNLDKPVIMGIVNVTPDSFSDGGSHATVSEALAFACQLAHEGADILDIGGESTRPGSAPLDPREEQKRILPVVKALVGEGYTVSVDTYHPETMRAVLDLGAHIINDVKGFTQAGAVDAVRGSDAGLVIMHFEAVRPGHLFQDIEAFLEQQSQLLFAAGVPARTICWDPGFGFGKTMEENLTLLEHFEDFRCPNYPVLIGVSRKRMIGAMTGISDPTKRADGSVKAALTAVKKGAHIVRVHDVAQTLAALKETGLR